MTMKIEVVEIETGAVVRSVAVSATSPSIVDRVARGMNINLDHSRYFTRTILAPIPEPQEKVRG